MSIQHKSNPIRSSTIQGGLILAAGNPLLDISAKVSGDFLDKYGLKPNDAIIATEKQHKLPYDVMENYQVDYLAGGSAQNTIRVVQWFFSRPYVGTFFGAIGRDKFGQNMQQRAEEEGLKVVYMVVPDVPTGSCVCLITNNGKNRSLCAFLGASQKFTVKHVRDNFEYIEKAMIIYTTGFHLIVSLESTLLMAEHCHKWQHKKFVFNLSAPFVSKFFWKEVCQIIPYTDILFGNETEAQAFADMKGWKTNNLEVIAQLIADLEHKNHFRVVLITQGKDDVLVAETGRQNLKRFPVQRLPDSEIVDTNGAGDSFVGGFLAMLAQGRPLEDCVKTGIYSATEIIKMSGCTLPKDNVYRI